MGNKQAQQVSTELTDKRSFILILEIALLAR